MDGFRYLLALAFVCAFLPMLFFWPLIHGFIRFWRRLGPALTYVVVLVPAVLMGVAIFQLRAPLLAVEFGTRWPLVAAGAVLLLAGTWLRILLHRDLTHKLLSGFPELDPERYPQQLVRTGLYARVRHPRYLQVTIALLGYVLVANYLAGYFIWLAWLPAMYAISFLEERELRERFGEEYEHYRLEVPRLLPGIRRRGRPGDG